MAAHAERWIEPGLSLRTPLIRSLGLHLSLFLIVAGYMLLDSWGRERFGDPHSLGGGSVTITPVAQIPIPQPRSQPNPLADDTESEAPTPVKPIPAARPKPEPDAIPIRKKNAEPQKPAKPQREFRRTSDLEQPKSNQVTTNQGRRLSSPMFGGQSPGAGITVGPGTPFGNRFGYYADLVRRRVAEAWQTNQIDPRVQNAPIAIVTFDILKDGSVRNVRIRQGSGISSVDYSAQRAILDASPFPPLPNGFQRSSANVEFWFQFQR